MNKNIIKNNEQIIIYLFGIFAVISLIISILTLNSFLIGLSLFLGFSCFILYKMWDIIENVIFKHSNLIQVFNGYELNNNRYVAIRKINKFFSATSIALIKINETDIDKIKLENIIANINIPFKIVIQIERVNLEKLLDNLKTKLYLKQIAISKLENSSNKKFSIKIDQAKKYIVGIEQDIKNIELGLTPLKLCYYIMTSALSENKFIAEEESKQRIKTITNQFNAIFSSYSEIVYGHELLRLLELDSEMVF